MKPDVYYHGLQQPAVYYHGLAPFHAGLASPAALVILLAVLAILGAGSFGVAHLRRTT